MSLVRSELIKLRTVRVNYILGIIAVAFPLVVIVLVAALTTDKQQTAADLVGTVTGTMVLSSLLLGVICALSLTSEYSHNTIRVTFAAAPQRAKVLLVKALVGVGFTIAVAVVVDLACYGAGRVILNGRNATSVLTGTQRAALLGAVILAALLSMLGYGLGLVIRNSPATITIFILWPLLLENLVRLVLSAAGVHRPTPWLPVQSAILMTNPDRNLDDPSRLHGGVYLGVVVLVIIAVGILINERRDA